MDDTSSTNYSPGPFAGASMPVSAQRQPDKSRLFVRIAEGWEAAAAVAADLDHLRSNALEPSPSSESWMLIPALRYLRGDATIKVVLIYAPDASSPDRPEVLCAAFPLEVKRRYRGLPIKVLSLWNHAYSLFPAPLLRVDCTVECMEALFSWIAGNLPASTLVEFGELRTESAFFRVLTDMLRHDHLEYLVTDVLTRALYRPGNDIEGDIENTIVGHHPRLRRYERRLRELGTLESDELAPDGPLDAWIDEFIALEMRGWKGREGSAFGCNENNSAWLRSVLRYAIPGGRATMLALRLDGNAIAMKLNFIDWPGSYAFKVTFDETYAKYSPGTLLELENIRWLIEHPRIQWMDSLAAADNPLANRVWSNRSAVTTLLVAPRRFLAETVVTCLPILRLIRRWPRRGR